MANCFISVLLHSVSLGQFTVLIFFFVINKKNDDNNIRNMFSAFYHTLSALELLHPRFISHLTFVYCTTVLNSWCLYSVLMQMTMSDLETAELGKKKKKNTWLRVDMDLLKTHWRYSLKFSFPLINRSPPVTSRESASKVQLMNMFRVQNYKLRE